MDWLNIHTSTLDSPEFIGAAPDERATWLCLLRYCAGQENGGTIQNCRDWGDRRWQQLCRVTKDEAESASELWRWDGSDLRVTFYPVSKESEVKAKREAARANGRLGGRPENKPSTNPAGTNVGSISITQQEPTLAESPKAEGNGMEGEWKEKGMENKHIAAAPLVLGLEEVPAGPVPVSLNSPEQVRVGALFHRRPSTPWSASERKAWKTAKAVVQDMDPTAWALLEAWYLRPPEDAPYRRTDLAALLNNWHAEIEKARRNAGSARDAAAEVRRGAF